MPSISNTGSRSAGTLYVVATPIGNLEDITLRALAVLKSVDLIAAEDTRQTRHLLTRHGIRRPLISYHEHNETGRTPGLVDRMRDGAAVALVSNAGTPGISDPGFRLVAAAAEAGVTVVPVPGPVAAAAALSAAGLPTDAFVFAGFLPRRAGKRLDLLKALSLEPRTLIVYESPRRLAGLLKEIQTVLGDRRAVLARELTKIHEEFIRGRLSEIVETLEQRVELKGECTLLVAGGTPPEPSSWETVRSEIRTELVGGTTSLAQIAKKAAGRHGLPRQAVYAEAVRIKAGLQDQNQGSLKP